jgi:hypothetical protein
MKKRFLQKSLLFLFLFGCNIIQAQTLPVGTPYMEDVWRRLQISGERDINSSFSIRPLTASTIADYDSFYYAYNAGEYPKRTSTRTFAKGEESILRILPGNTKTAI